MESFPKCQVCQQHFTLKGPVPYLLPCLHAVCETCVTSTDGGVISCSTCQREVNLTETDLQKDVMRHTEIFHLTVQHRPSELLCQHEDDGNQAVCWCQECEEFLCEHCQNLHESFKATKSHPLQDIGDIQPGSLEKEEVCIIHKKYPLDLWDKICGIMICAKCRRGDHAEHDVEDIDEAAVSTRKELEAQEKEMQSAADNHNSFLEMMREQLGRTFETSSTSVESINHTFSSLKALLDQREKELVIALHQQTSERKSHLEKMTTASESGTMKCNIATEYIHKCLLYSSKYDLLSLRRTLGEASRICLASAPPEKQEGTSLSVFYNGGLDKLKITLSSFGDVTAQEEGMRINITEEMGTQTEMVFSQIQAEPDKEIDISTRNDGDVAGAEATDTDGRKESDVMRDETKQKTQEISELRRKVQESEASENVLKRRNAELETTIRQLEQSNTDREKKIRDTDQHVNRLHSSLNNIGLSPEADFHLLKESTGEKSLILQCIPLEFDRRRANEEAHVNKEGCIVNRPYWGLCPYDINGRVKRLAKYDGTTSTASLLRCGYPQYWELKANVVLDNTLTENLLILEIGLCREEYQDIHHCISGHPYSYVFNVAYCLTHNTICRKIRRHGDYVLCLPHTLPNTPRQTATLHYGVVYDDARHRVVFLDITENKVISELKGVDSSQPLWPMFGVYNHHYVSVTMSLVVGHKITMWDGKKHMILKSLE